MRTVPSSYAGISISSHFQPVYSLAHRRTVGMELLLRASLEGKALSPAEAYQRIAPQERGAFDLAICAHHASQFQKQVAEPNWLFLNIDAISLQCPDQTQKLAEAIIASGVPAETVVLEIAEQALDLDDHILPGIAELKEIGFLLAIDDFGVGHANLDRIGELAPDLIKLEGYLLRRASQQPRIRNLLKKLVHLMHGIGALVVQEGIETENDVLMVLDSGCDLIQGCFLAQPQAVPGGDEDITPRVDACWDELMVRDLLKRKVSRRQRELARQSFMQTAISLMQNIPFDEAAKPMLNMPDVVRCFLLDSGGRQIGRNLNSYQGSTADNPRFAPLANTTGAVWSRRSYFQHAIDQPGMLYMSDPYLSMTDTRSCVTLSMAIEINETVHVLCADILT